MRRRAPGSRRRCTSRSIWRTAPWFWCGGTTPWLRKGVSERVGTAVAAVGCDNIVGQYRIKVCNDDRTAVVIDATELFCTDIPELSPIGEGYDPFDISAVMKTGLTRVTDVRSLNGELYVCTSTQYSVSEWRFIFPVAVNLPVDVDVVFSLVPMPEESMRPRPADDRIGLFTIEKKVLSEEGGPVGEVKYAARWNIVPADTRPTCAASSRTRCARSRCTWTRICPRRGASR